MELLTGKTLIDFGKHLIENHKIASWELFYNLPKVCQYALIIEFFDSVGIYIEIKNKFGQNKQRQRFSFVVKKYNSGFMFDTRLEATEQGIKIANNFYNEI